MTKSVYVGKSPFVGPGKPIYRLDPPKDGFEYVVVSGINHEYAHEVMIFGCSEAGDPKDWLELYCETDTDDEEGALARWLED